MGMPTESTPGVSVMRRSVRAGAALLVASLALVVSACIPSTPTGNWALMGPGVVKSNATGATPGVLLVGDSLIHWSDPQVHANALRLFTGRSATVAAVGGSSYSHWMNESLIKGVGLTTIPNYVNFLKPRITVFALGTNDARIMSQEQPQPLAETNDNGYRLADFASSVNSAISSALTKSKCVILVNVQTDLGAEASFPRIASRGGVVNGYLSQVAAGRSDRRVRLANWSAFSAGHRDWFVADGVHHTATGQAQYRSFIVTKVSEALKNGC